MPQVKDLLEFRIESYSPETRFKTKVDGSSCEIRYFGGSSKTEYEIAFTDGRHRLFNNGMIQMEWNEVGGKKAGNFTVFEFGFAKYMGKWESLNNSAEIPHIVNLKKGKKPLSFRQDIQALFDRRLYRTMLFVPILCVLALTVVPLVYMILMAFTSYDHEHLPPASLFDWIGFEMFGKVFTSGQIAGTFFPVLGWTLVWAFCATVSCYFAGILLALLINKKGIVGRPIFRTVFVLTIAIPQFITLLTMNNFLHIDGPLNTLLLQWGITDERIGFLTEVSNNAILPRISVLAVNLWIGVPYTMLITTGILMNIPKDLFEAAKIDGASPVRLFASITLPYVLFVTGPYLIQQFIGNINNFNLIYLLSNGGPAVP